MKFYKGAWVLEKGVEINYCNQIRQIKINEDKTQVYLYAIVDKNDQRAVGGCMFEIFISAPQKDVFRITAHHFRGGVKNEPAFDLNLANLPMEVEEKEGTIYISNGSCSLVIQKNPASIKMFQNGKELVRVSERFGSCMLSYIQKDEKPYMCANFDVAPNENIYGLGEQFTPFIKNGQVVEMWNEDGGTCTNIAYKSIPFYVSTAGYGVFINDSGKVSFEVCSESVTKAQVSTPGQKIDVMLIGGGDIKSVISNYTLITGRPPLVPAWTFGLWLTSSFTTSYEKQTVMSFINGMKQRDIPFSVFHIDCFWMKENEWCGFEWDEDAFPNVEQFISEIKNQGLKLCLWINPYIGQKSPTFFEAAEAGYLLKRNDGSVWQWDMWQSGMGIVDFTNPQAVEWYKNKLRKLLDLGVDAFKTDFGERIPTDCIYYDNSNTEKMHNYYTLLYNKAVYEVLEERYGKNNACLFARSATVGCQKYPVHWGGDSMSTFPSMYESLRGGLSLSMSGFAYWSHDIGGFEGTCSYGLFKRWLAFGLLSSHSRLHGSINYKVPWLYGEESVEVCRRFAKLKNSLMPYIYAQAVYASQTGIPMMRPMAMEFNGDIAAEYCDKQYMFGDSILVAPIFNEEGYADVYLPKGSWTNYFTGEVISGEKYVRVSCDYMQIPMFIKNNTLLTVGFNEDTPDYDYAKDLTVKAYCIDNKTSREVYDTNGNLIGQIHVERNGNKLKVKVDGDISQINLVLVGITTCKAVNGEKVLVQGNDSHINITKEAEIEI